MRISPLLLCWPLLLLLLVLILLLLLFTSTSLLPIFPSTTTGLMRGYLHYSVISLAAIPPSTTTTAATELLLQAHGYSLQCWLQGCKPRSAGNVCALPASYQHLQQPFCFRNLQPSMHNSVQQISAHDLVLQAVAT
jgi:hypothetical protein